MRIGFCCEFRCSWPREKQGKRALTFAGGGFLSFTNFNGVISGLLSVMGNQATLDSLLANFGTLSSISGGGWYLAELAYSKQFQDLTYSMAQHPDTAGKLFHDEWFSRAMGVALAGDFSGAGGLSGEALQCMLSTILSTYPDLDLAGMLDEFGGGGLAREVVAKAAEAAAAAATTAAHALKDALGGEATAHMLMGILALLREAGIPQLYLESAAEMIVILGANGHLTWEDMVAHLLERTSGISRSQPLGSGVNEWAEGKLLLFGGTLPVPGRNHSGVANNLTEVVVYNPADVGEEATISYTVQTDKADLISDMIPVRFSHIGGNDSEGRSPMTFCGSPDCFGISQTYHAGGEDTVAPGSLGEQFSKAFETNSSSLPLVSVAAVTSAFEWVQGVRDFDGRSACFAMSVWADRTPNGAAFSQGAQVREGLWEHVDSSNAQETSRSLAEVGLVAMGDGGNTDEPGIGNALAAGAVEITALLYSDITSVETLGVPRNTAYRSLNRLFPGTPNNDPVRVVFAEPSYEGLARDFYPSMKRIPVSGSSEFFSAIAYGKLECVTADNPWMGVEGGRNVTIDVVVVETTNITIGLLNKEYSFESFSDYGTLLQEIMTTMIAEENREQVEEIIAGYFL